MLKIYSSNCAEALVGKLAERLAVCQGSWTDQDVVLVQSKGMERWLNLQLAQKNGISANIEFPFPKAFAIRILKGSGLLGDGANLSREDMAWKIFSLLPDLEQRASFEVIKNYVNVSSNIELRRYQLSVQLAGIFDNYLVFRPDMLAYWSGELEMCQDKVWDSHPWQAELWREMFSGDDELFAKSLKVFVETCPDLSSLNLPKEIHLFGFPTLPPVMLQFYQSLANSSGNISVNLYYLSPCRAYWADTVSERTVIYKELQGDSDYWETGNPLLASMGELGRDFLGNIIDIAGDSYDGDFSDVDNFASGLLGVVQSDISNFVKPEEAEPLVHDSSDKSLLINSCHSPMREVEVLYDHLLDLIDSSEEPLQPCDILVMAPDINKYAPYIRSVFDNPESEKQRIAFTIADGSLMEESNIVRIFFNLLNLVHSRFTSRDVIDLLENESIFKRFGLKEQDLELIRDRVVKSRICWGVDEKFRDEISPEMSGFSENSWRFGFDRLMMGYAMPETEMFDGEVLPCDLEGSQATVIGKLMDFVDRLASLVDELKSRPERSGEEWQELLNNLLENFFIQNRETANELLEVRKVVAVLSINLKKAGCDKNIELSVLVSWLIGAMEDETAAYGFLQRGVTFCKLLPMRSIPAKVVCVLGLNDGEFPRQDRRVSFDIMKLSSKRGDRSIRKDDRYLFLEALLSARQSLYLSYTGRSIQDNEVIPPSVMVTELLDYLDLRHESKISDVLLTEHHLQAFDKSYFVGDQKLFSYSSENLNASKILQSREPQSGSEFVDLTETFDNESQNNEVSLDNLIRFYRNPSDFYLKNHLRVNLNLLEETLPDETERFEKEGGLVGYFHREIVLNSLIETDSECEDLRSELYNQFRLKGELPVGVVGKKSFDSMFDEAVSFYLSLDCEIGGRTLQAPFDLENLSVGESKLSGRLDGIYGEGDESCQICYHFGSGSAFRKLRAQLLHLVAIVSGVANETNFVYYSGSGDNKKVKVDTFKSVTKEKAESLLKIYLELFVENQTKPMIFFPETSWTYWDSYNNGDSENLVANALEEAVQQWNPSKHNPFADGADAAFIRCFGQDFQEDSELFIQQFCATAEMIYGEMLNDQGGK